MGFLSKVEVVSFSYAEIVLNAANSYAKTLEDLSKGMTAYIERKLERRVNSDYIGNEDKLKAIGKVLMNAELQTDKAYKSILNEVG